MPLYSYFCKKCRKYFEIIVPLKDSGEPIECKYCREKLGKIITPVMFKVN